MLKEAEYWCEDCQVEGRPNRVVYFIVDGCCYFSGIDRGPGTINAAEEVIQSIANQEGVPVKSFRYVDIQTYKGYAGRLPGAYDVDELEIKIISGTPLAVVSWKKTTLPPDVFDVFKKHIGVDLKTIYADVWEESEGLVCVCDENGMWFFVHFDGTPAFAERYPDLALYRKGLAWVCRGNDEWAQIDHEGNVKSEWISGKELWKD